MDTCRSFGALLQVQEKQRNGRFRGDKDLESADAIQT